MVARPAAACYAKHTMNEIRDDGLTFDCPATYCIRVRGRIPARWSERLGEMAITADTPGNGPSVTTLTGELADQASLAGVLRTLYELHLPVLSVECLGGTTW